MSGGIREIAHEFVSAVPAELESGTLYVCVEYAITAHLCLCGCGHEVIAPLTPTDWRLTYDGETVSLAPSIGNWSFPCRSHYVICRDRVLWAGRWSAERVERGRARDRHAKDEQFADGGGAARGDRDRVEDLEVGGVDKSGRWWKRLRSLAGR